MWSPWRTNQIPVYTQFRTKCLKSTLYLLLPQLKNCRSVLFSMFKAIFPFAFCQDDRRITMLLAPGHNRATFLVTVPWTVRNTHVMGNYLKNTTVKPRTRFALIVAVKSCGKFLTTEKSVLYFKINRKAKSKWPIGGFKFKFCMNR